jgi:hypothetical protein
VGKLLALASRDTTQHAPRRDQVSTQQHPITPFPSIPLCSAALTHALAMSRPGSLPASQASGLAGTNLTPSLQTLLQKQQEHAGLQALREASAELLARVEKLAEMSNVMADGGEGGSPRVYLSHKSHADGT